jgi:hypothetical protein
MSDEFANGNNGSSMDLFYKRYNYVFTTEDLSVGYGNLMDFTGAEKMLYGRVNRHYVPIVLSPILAPKTIPGAGSNPVPITAAPFVADAFADLVMQFRKSLMSGQIHSDAQALTDLRAVRAYEDVTVLHSKHMHSVLLGLRDSFRRGRRTYRDFDEFMPLFMDAMEALMKVYPFTLSGYIKHRLCPLRASGLVIEISTGNYSNDDQKIEDFVSSPNWEYYLNACRSYGFIVDRSAPWRLVADIGSTTMIEYARRYSMTSTDAILGLGYATAHSVYYDRFVGMIRAAYDFLKTNNYVEVQCYDDAIPIGKVITAADYTNETLMQKYGEAYFLELYLKFRLMEEESKIAPHEQEKLIRQTMKSYSTGKKMESIGAFERVIGRTYDYSGSLTNIRKGAKLREEDAFREEDLDGAVSTYR